MFYVYDNMFYNLYVSNRDGASNNCNKKTRTNMQIPNNNYSAINVSFQKFYFVVAPLFSASLQKFLITRYPSYD